MAAVLRTAPRRSPRDPGVRQRRRHEWLAAERERRQRRLPSPRGSRSAADNAAIFTIYRLVTPGYFDTIGIPLLEGRDFGSQDGIETAPVVVINQAFANRFWPGQSGVGKRVAFAKNPKPEDWSTVVAVVGNTHHSSLTEPIDLQLYVPYTQEPNWYPPGQIVLRTSGEPTAIANAVRERIRTIDPMVPIADVQSMDALVATSVATPRFHVVLLGALSLSALVLATIGIYGLLAFSVALRTREIGVRAALGASRNAIAGMILGEGLRLTGAGIVIGLLASLLRHALARDACCSRCSRSIPSPSLVSRCCCWPWR